MASPEAEMSGRSVEDALRDLLERVPVSVRGAGERAAQPPKR
jgi:hypothetical protein